jgi:hypothetical protein
LPNPIINFLNNLEDSRSLLHVVFNVNHGEAAKQSCAQNDVGLERACPASPYCLTVAAKVCIGNWHQGSCDKKSFWCWQKACSGDPRSRDVSKDSSRV